MFTIQITVCISTIRQMGIIVSAECFSRPVKAKSACRDSRFHLDERMWSECECPICTDIKDLIVYMAHPDG